MKRRKYRKDGLVSRVNGFIPFKDSGGEYIAYCNSDCHRGIVLRPYVCERRDCKSYYKFYVNRRNETK
jgi:hypothetical protein